MSDFSTKLGEKSIMLFELQKSISTTLYDKLTVADICRFVEIFEEELSKFPESNRTFPRKLEALPTAIAIWKKDYDERHKVRAIGSV